MLSHWVGGAPNSQTSNCGRTHGSNRFISKHKKNKNDTQIPDIDPVSSDLLPGFDDCGVNTQSRIYGGEKTDLDEFPWMALIEYEKRNDSNNL